MSLSATNLLVALQHADGQFPSGGFAFSQGLEASSSLADRLGVFEFADFVDTQIRHRWADADRVALVRAYRLAGDLDALAELDREVEASTFVEGLRSGSRRNGTALLTTHGRLGTKGATAYRGMVRYGSACGHLAVVQGLVWQALGLDEATAVAIGGYQMVASLATAAVRLGLIGAIDAQASMARALPAIEAAACRPVADGEALRSFTPLCEIAVAMHGTSGQRLAPVHYWDTDIRYGMASCLIVAQGQITVGVERQGFRPDVIAGDVDVVPAQRGEAGRDRVFNLRAAYPRFRQYSPEVAAVEQDYGGRDEVEGSGSA